MYELFLFLFTIVGLWFIEDIYLPTQKIDLTINDEVYKGWY
jgi:hypothetical protein